MKRLNSLLSVFFLGFTFLVSGIGNSASAQSTIAAPTISVAITDLVFAVGNEVQVTWDINIVSESPGTAQIEIVDEYGEFGGIADWPLGQSLITLSFVATVDPGDTDGRTFTLVVRAENEGGSTEASSSFVIPPGGIEPPGGDPTLDELRAELQALKDQRHQLTLDYRDNRRELCQQRKAEFQAATNKKERREIQAKYRQLLRDLTLNYTDSLRSINRDIREIRKLICQLLKEMRKDNKGDHGDKDDDHGKGGNDKGDKDDHDNRDKSKH